MKEIPGDTKLQICLLGPFEVYVNGQPVVRIHSRKEQWLLALLVLHPGQELSREWLATTLWPENPLHQALAYLRRALYLLKTVLEEEGDRLETPTPRTLCIDLEGAFADTVAFDSLIARGNRDALREATALYRGPLLEGCEEDWAEGARSALEAKYRAVLERLSYQAEDWEDEPLADDAPSLAEATPAHEDQKPDAAGLAGQIPRALTPFIGREYEVNHVLEALKTAPLVTLTGMGGVGKTRTAMEVARRWDEGEVWFVELAPITSSTPIARVIARAIGVGEASSAPADESLINALGRRTGLLVLDNCEHVLDASADIALRLIQACQGMRILATSRHPLSVIGETCWPIEPFETPDPAAQMSAASADSLMAYPAIQLFVQQARNVQPAFRMTAGNAAAVAQICVQLDGIPLAIELAAAWAKALAIERISRGLADRFEFLSSGVRTRLPHHQTLRAMIDWSYQLLQDRERTLLHRLSVFAGGWTLELAEKICADDLPAGLVSKDAAPISSSQVLMLISGLVDQSLVQVELSGPEARYSMLETIRQYAAERLEEGGETDAMRQRHCLRYVEFAETLSEEARGPRQQECLREFETEHDNFLAAVLWAVEREHSPATGIRLCGALLNLWVYRGYYREGGSWSERALGRLPDDDRSPSRALGLATVGTFMWMLGNLQRAYEMHLQALALRREHGDLSAIAVSAERTGAVLMQMGNYADARQYLSEAIESGRVTGNKAVLSMSLINRGCVDYELDHLDQACELWQEALTVTRALGNRIWTAVALGNLGDIAIRQGDFATARATYEESLQIFKENGDKGGVAVITRSLGMLADAEKRYDDARRLITEALIDWREWGNSAHMVLGTESLAFLALSEAADGCKPPEICARHAARLLGAVESAREKLEYAVVVEARIQYTHKLALLKALLGEEEMRLLWNAGRALTLDDAAAEALSGIP